MSSYPRKVCHDPKKKEREEGIAKLIKKKYTPKTYKTRWHDIKRRKTFKCHKVGCHSTLESRTFYAQRQSSSIV